MGANACQVKYLMLGCYSLVGTQPLKSKPQLFDKPNIYSTWKWRTATSWRPPHPAGFKEPLDVNVLYEV
jgi:hypothetical protein